MSTRATYSFKNSLEEWTPETCIYIHYDGYPEGAASYFWAMLHLENLRGDQATRFIRANDLAEITLSHEAHGDTEYRYSVDGNQLTAYKRVGDWSENEPNFDEFFSGTWYEFVNKYGSGKTGISTIENFSPIRYVAWGRYEKRYATHAQLVARAEHLIRKYEEYKVKFPDSTGNIAAMNDDAKAVADALAEWPESDEQAA
jgi:hypothetical protein